MAEYRLKAAIIVFWTLGGSRNKQHWQVITFSVFMVNLLANCCLFTHLPVFLAT